ncbi:hypothetical protein [Paenimyroides viscosum]|uniref:Uncharacterized protein n=1 Tax=Paenimyroides viscosum TaxID=2488729 RepID=A0A3P1B525_9FLAO|nr:hypothetical protein [Paenimyroides viscosum]RRA96079.1 hypothetical protein EG242_04120 [Paenimyroides viscosum]
MKNSLLFVSLIIVVFNCYSTFAQPQNKYDLELNQFEKELEYKKITPTYRIQVESDMVRFEDFIISFSELDDSLKIYINKDTLNVYKLITQNIVEDEKQQVDYANSPLEINYYKELNILMFLVHFYPCTGLGCGVNYQVMYHTKTKKSFAFGRFRTGFDMELYNYNDDKPYYLSKSFNGRNIEGIDTIRYELFPIDFSLQELHPLKEIFAEIVTDENENETISFQKQWIK